ncbi:DUF6461 domain-containing protein [Nonomuraea aridisoli]|uniref:Uncharacterized protein n=1 Tax=Nonomuraea aridisoli TaxID=2070368 RepID=A0A2W2F3N1_9ACTN|nr:DUF6461 domain-containing protein [Nonomuraea aridisoli]PZG19618.1 hypothetical protein C1J01_11615 [Nonomuraea aridisoli]
MTTDPLAPYRWLETPEGSPANPLDVIYCVSFLRGVDPAEVLRRFDPEGPPGREMGFDELEEAVHEFVEETDGGAGGGYAGVVAAGEWSVAVELWGWFGTIDDHGIARTFALAALITGVPMSRDLLAGPFLVGAVAEGRG